MNQKTPFIQLLSRLLWLMPFVCFLGGYYTLDLFFHHSFLKTPSVVGTPLAKALHVLSQHNLNARLLTYKEDLYKEPGTILHQNPSPLSSIRPQQTVFLVASCLPTQTKTPACIGKSYTECAAHLKSKTISYITYYLPSNYPQGTCLAQIPDADSDLPPTGLTLYIAQNTAYSSFLIPSFIQRPLKEVTSFLKEHSIPFTVFHTYPAKEGHTCATCTVVAQKPLAGSYLQKNNPPTIQLQVND